MVLRSLSRAAFARVKFWSLLQKINHAKLPVPLHSFIDTIIGRMKARRVAINYVPYMFMYPPPIFRSHYRA